MQSLAWWILWHRAAGLVIRIQGQFRPALFAVLAAMQLPPSLPAAEFRVNDIFGRSLQQSGITLVDWEGQIANPAIEIFVTPPPEAAPFPTTATLSANGARLCFDLPSSVGAHGPSKVIVFPDATTAVPVRISIFPDRDGLDEEYMLTIRLNSAALTNEFPVRVIDQDIVRPAEFAVTVDFSRDRSGFFDDLRPRAIVEQAAADWAYFLGDMRLDEVAPGSESTFVWEAGGVTNGVWATNASAYRGFLFYASGVHNPELRSSGCASECGLQSSGGVMLPLRRSGSCGVETAGNYNALGWFFTQSDNDCWSSGNLIYEPNDFYSIVHHEIGHALFFCAAHPRFEAFKSRAVFDDGAVAAYQRDPVRIDGEDHFSRAVDAVSGAGAFGSEYSGTMPRGRWLVTKLDLLAARALGYHVRPTSALTPLQMSGGGLPQGRVDQPYTFALPVTGGIPARDFLVVQGALPVGLVLDRFTGTLAGIPAVPGVSHFTVQVRDQDPLRPVVTAHFTVSVGPVATLAAGEPLERRRAELATADGSSLESESLFRVEPVALRAPAFTLPLYRVP